LPALSDSSGRFRLAADSSTTLGRAVRLAAVADRPDVPNEILRRLRATFATFPEISEEHAWVGVRWQVGRATVAHVFGGEDQRFRVTFRAELDEMLAFEHLGEPYFRAGWGSNVVGLLLDDDTDWDEIGELLTDSYCIQAPTHLAAQVTRPDLTG
jgi:hypothetical protein